MQEKEENGRNGEWSSGVVGASVDYSHSYRFCICMCMTYIIFEYLYNVCVCASVHANGNTNAPRFGWKGHRVRGRKKMKKKTKTAYTEDCHKFLLANKRAKIMIMNRRLYSCMVTSFEIEKISRVFLWVGTKTIAFFRNFR